MKKLAVLISTLLATSLAIAETCPTIAQIRANNLNGWSAYTNDEGEPLTPTQLQAFEQNVGGFYSIRWLGGAPEGESHCYYVNKQRYWTRAFLSKSGLVPDFSSPNWTYVDDEPRCHASIAGCPFLPQGE
jgi:hypothetical protein